MLSRGRARDRATFQMYRVAVLLPERFRGGCSFGADTEVSVSSNDGGSLSHGVAAVKRLDPTPALEASAARIGEIAQNVFVMAGCELLFA
jgi:hypothetical protein